MYSLPKAAVGIAMYVSPDGFKAGPAFWADFLGGAPDLNAALDTFGLGPLAELPADLLSAGQKRRLALSRLFAASRPISRSSPALATAPVIVDPPQCL